MRTTTILTALVLLGACKADHSLGSIERDAGNDSGLASPDSSITTPGEAVDVQPLGPLGPVESWTGWVENYQFKSGSDAVRFSFASDPSGRIAGQVILGAGTPPPPATDPNAGYPEDMMMFPGFPIEGYAYTMFDGSITSNRIRFTVRQYEPWTGWCALQTPPSDVGSGNARCILLGDSMVDPANDLCVVYPDNQKYDAGVRVPCGKFVLCQSGVCFCSPTGCRGRVPEDQEPFMSPPVPTVSFDMAYSGTIATGSMGSQNVHFTKDQ